MTAACPRDIELTSLASFSSFDNFSSDKPKDDARPIVSKGLAEADEGAYLHVGSDTPVIQVVGIAKEVMADSNVLWLL